MSKNKKRIVSIIAVALALCIVGAGAYVGNMLGYFCEGNKAVYSVKHSDDVNSTLDGKRIIFLGSSVTYGYAAKGESFVDYLQAQDGVLPIKEAVSGTTLVDDSKKSYVSRLKRIDTDIKVDALVCQLSTNDATKGKPLGELSDSFDIDSFDTHTVIGAIEYIIAYSRQAWDCPVVFYTGTKYDSANYQAMVDALISIQKKWDIGVIDLWNDEGMNSVSPDDYKLYMCDNIHPTRAGYRDWWTPAIRDYLQNYLI